MKIAIPSDEGTVISQHFGRTLGFTVVEITHGQIISQEYRLNNFTGHATGQHQEYKHNGADQGDHAQHSHNRILNALNDCEVVIAGGMGRRLVDDLVTAGKKIYITSETEVTKAVELFIANELRSDKHACAPHH
jgi:predicted Fe-Mo cluster-binding NifX family protein